MESNKYQQFHNIYERIKSLSIMNKKFDLPSLQYKSSLSNIVKYKNGNTYYFLKEVKVEQNLILPERARIDDKYNTKIKIKHCITGVIYYTTLKPGELFEERFDTIIFNDLTLQERKDIYHANNFHGKQDTYDSLTFEKNDLQVIFPDYRIIPARYDYNAINNFIRKVQNENERLKKEAEENLAGGESLLGPYPKDKINIMKGRPIDNCPYITAVQGNKDFTITNIDSNSSNIKIKDNYSDRITAFNNQILINKDGWVAAIPIGPSIPAPIKKDPSYDNEEPIILHKKKKKRHQTLYIDE